MKLIRPDSNMHKFARVVLSTICLLISGFPTSVFAESASVQSNTYNVNHQLLHTETKSCYRSNLGIHDVTLASRVREYCLSRGERCVIYDYISDSSSRFI